MWLLSPLSWMLCCLLLLGWSWQRRQRQQRPWLVRSAVALLMTSVLAMTPLLANTLLAMLENQYSAPDCHPDQMRDGVLLGGGTDQLPVDATDVAALSIASRRRAERAAQWWRQVPGRRLWVAGGTPVAGYAPESRLISLYLQGMGVPESAISEEPRSRSTWGNARNLAAMQAPPPRNVVLVTSAMHMPRAVFAMRHAGFQVCPLQADYRQQPFELPGYLIPQASALAKSEASIHELVGMLYYRLRALLGWPS
ncbi:YdcF family protein [Pseudoxanthomonas dokdonensis]|uniref:DUF218 domain-containing protein n=1 Tax=Pseudoxanthomonas dokdonensis TaxID=344882 RepID=A0A0R0CRN5_9GAMM|nr:YdcF family protein [Pseudoxanthomonas dokdonensis]KRG68954.1 hypothetical protein ABB29_10880 [Pseudoxanthomonas dokdonensis]